MNPYLPNQGSEIHPLMPLAMHGVHMPGELITPSRLSHACEDLNVSIHDRERVYSEMKRVEQEMLFGKEAK